MNRDLLANEVEKNMELVNETLNRKKSYNGKNDNYNEIKARFDELNEKYILTPVERVEKENLQKRLDEMRMQDPLVGRDISKIMPDYMNKTNEEPEYEEKTAAQQAFENYAFNELKSDGLIKSDRIEKINNLERKYLEQRIQDYVNMADMDSMERTLYRATQMLYLDHGKIKTLIPEREDKSTITLDNLTDYEKIQLNSQHQIELRHPEIQQLYDKYEQLRQMGLTK